MQQAKKPLTTRLSVLGFAVLLTLSFSVIELVGGWWANSLALIGDAGHMVTDSMSLLFALVANRLAMKAKIYHLDKDGYRDALVDPATGMAYIEECREDGTVRTLVWPVNVRKDEFGNVIARDKITTSRIATVGENKDGYAEDETLDVVNNSTAEIPDADKPSYTHTESGHITGTWKGNASVTSWRSISSARSS